MAGGVEGNGGPADPAVLTIGDAFGGDRAKALADDGKGLIGGKVCPHPGARVVAVAMGDKRAGTGRQGSMWKSPAGQ